MVWVDAESVVACLRDAKGSDDRAMDVDCYPVVGLEYAPSVAVLAIAGRVLGGRPLPAAIGVLAHLVPEARVPDPSGVASELDQVLLGDEVHALSFDRRVWSEGPRMACCWP